MRVGVIGGRTAHVRVVIPLTAAMGGIEVPTADGVVDGADEPAELEGYGPIPASVARALAAGGPWARMVTDPVDRTVLEVSSDSYEPPPAMASLVRAREPKCVSPSCSVPSDSCDLHHRIPWPVGPTSVTNLDPGCRRDHLLLTHGGWSYVVDAAGCRTWTTAAGLVYVEDTSGNLTLRKPTPDPTPDPSRQHTAEQVRRREDGPPPY